MSDWKSYNKDVSTKMECNSYGTVRSYLSDLAKNVGKGRGVTLD